MESKKTIDYYKLVSEVLKYKRLYYYVLPIVFVLSCVYIFSIPRGYDTETEVVPESEGSLPKGTGALSALTSSLGLNMNSLQSNDAITPLLYPELLDDNGFVAELFAVKVTTSDGLLTTTYYDYVMNHQKTAWWKQYIIYPIINLFASRKDGADGNRKFNPYMPTKDEYDVMDYIRGVVKFKVDKKTAAITITTSDQDPLVCKTLADSVRNHLQNYITRYRTNKARTDVRYYTNLVKKAKLEYEAKRDAYGKYSDLNSEVVLTSVRAKQESMENEMQMAYNAYTALSNQLQLAEAKLQARTPAFMIVKGATVPEKPTSPKRIIFVLIMQILAFMGTTGYILFKLAKK